MNKPKDATYTTSALRRVVQFSIYGFLIEPVDAAGYALSRINCNDRRPKRANLR